MTRAGCQEALAQGLFEQVRHGVLGGVGRVGERLRRQRLVRRGEYGVRGEQQMEGAGLLVRGQRLQQQGLDGRARPGVLARRASACRGPFAEVGGQLAQSVQQQLLLGLEVVLHQPQGDPGLGGHVAHAHLVQSATAGDPDEGPGDRGPPLLVVDALGHAAHSLFGLLTTG